MPAFELPTNTNTFLDTSFSSSDAPSPRAHHHSTKSHRPTRHPLGEGRTNRPHRHRPQHVRGDKVMQSSPLRGRKSCDGSMAKTLSARSMMDRAENGGWELYGELTALSQAEPNKYISDFLALSTTSPTLSTLPTAIQISLLLMNLPLTLSESGRDHIARLRLSGEPITLASVAQTCRSTSLSRLNEQREDAASVQSTITRMGSVLSTAGSASPSSTTAYSTPPRRFITHRSNATQPFPKPRPVDKQTSTSPFIQLLGSPLKMEMTTTTTMTSRGSEQVVEAASSFFPSAASTPNRSSSYHFNSHQFNRRHPSLPPPLSSQTYDTVDYQEVQHQAAAPDPSFSASYSYTPSDFSDGSLPPLDVNATPPRGPRLANVPFFTHTHLRSDGDDRCDEGMNGGRRDLDRGVVVVGVVSESASRRNGALGASGSGVLQGESHQRGKKRVKMNVDGKEGDEQRRCLGIDLMASDAVVRESGRWGDGAGGEMMEEDDCDSEGTGEMAEAEEGVVLPADCFSSGLSTFEHGGGGIGLGLY